MPAPKQSKKFDNDMQRATQAGLPNWTRPAGLVFAIVTLLFFMVLVFYREPLHDPDSRLPITTVLALGVSLSSSFLGGEAAAKGKIPFMKDMSPVSFSATSGIGVFVIVFLIGLLANARFAHYDITPAAERFRVAFDVWSDLRREPDLRNLIKLNNHYFAVVIYGSKDLNVQDIDISSVYAADATVRGGGTRLQAGQGAAMYFLNDTYDENHDGFPDVKFDFLVPEMVHGGTLYPDTGYIRVGGLLKSRARFEGVAKVRIIR